MKVPTSSPPTSPAGEAAREEIETWRGAGIWKEIVDMAEERERAKGKKYS
jgi:hypothetical protein